jgi:hypothetical protein
MEFWETTWPGLGLLDYNLVLVEIYLRETSRLNVGDGSVPAKGLNRALFSYMFPRSCSTTSAPVRAKPKVRFPNALRFEYPLRERCDIDHICQRGFFL